MSLSLRVAPILELARSRTACDDRGCNAPLSQATEGPDDQLSVHPLRRRADMSTPTPGPGSARPVPLPAPAPPPAPRRRWFSRFLWLGGLLGLTGLAIPLLYSWWSYRLARSITEDAFVEARIVNIAPQTV